MKDLLICPVCGNDTWEKTIRVKILRELRPSFAERPYAEHKIIYKCGKCGREME